MAKLRGTKNVYASRVASAVLDELKVRMILQALADGASPAGLAAIYGVGTETIRRIGRRESWAWVTLEVRTEPVQTSALDAVPLPERTQATDEAAKASLERLLALQGKDKP